MTIGINGGVLGSAAGAPLSQANDKERAAKESSATERQVTNELKAEKAAGIGQTEGDQAASDRDADGRRLWENTTQQRNAEQEEQPTAPPTEVHQAKDPTGQSGGELDLTG